MRSGRQLILMALLLPLGACGTDGNVEPSPSAGETPTVVPDTPTATVIPETPTATLVSDTPTQTQMATPSAEPTPTAQPESPTPSEAPSPTAERTPTTAPTPTAEPDFRLSGVIEYERVKTVCNGGSVVVCEDSQCCLDPDPEGISVSPARNIVVEVVSEDGETVLASTQSDLNGHYALGWSGTEAVRVIAWSETQSPTISVIDNTQDGALYGVVSPYFDASALVGEADGEHDIHIASGWDGESYDEGRAAAPFAVLDTAYEAAHQFQLARPNAIFEPLSVNWSVNNDSCDGTYEEGCIGTSHWNGQALYILGKEDIDTDEYDDHIIVHEWGHYFEDTVSRSDSPGGSHGFSDIKDMRLAFGEGFGNGLSAIILYPEQRYIDTYGDGQDSGFYIDIDDNTEDNDPYPGWYSESSVQAILYDLFDPYDEGEPLDTVELGLGSLYDVMVLEQPYSEGFTSIFSYITHLKSRNPDAAQAIDNFIGAVYDKPEAFGISVVADEWGSGESHDGEIDGVLEHGLYATLDYVDGDGIPLELTLNHGGEADDGISNWLSQNRYLRFVGDGSLTHVVMDCEDHVDVDLHVYHQGEKVGDNYYLNGELESDEFTELTAFNGVTYSVLLVGWHMDSTDSYTCTVHLEHE